MVVKRKSVDNVLNTLKPTMENKTHEYLAKTNQPSLPDSITFVAIKSKKSLEMWWHYDEQKTLVNSYHILGASGQLGPKLLEGDKQVPEGIYLIDKLNPNSQFYLSMGLNYPNAFDLKMATIDGRHQPGSDIFIHGKTASVGCLAMGDKVIEELFYFVGSIGRQRVKVIISPVDFRKGESHSISEIAWAPKLYEDIARSLKDF